MNLDTLLHEIPDQIYTNPQREYEFECENAEKTQSDTCIISPLKFSAYVTPYAISAWLYADF